MAIQSFASHKLETFFLEGRPSRRTGWQGSSAIVLRKLDMLDFAEQLADLASPPGNRLEALNGALKGFHSIRINSQWRVVFRWTPFGPGDVDIVDYH